MESHLLASPLTLAAWSKSLSQPESRDKLLRLIQYTCRLLRGLDAGRAIPKQDTAAAAAQALDAAMASSRQVSRLAKWAVLYAKRRPLSTGAAPKSTLDLCAVLSDVGLGLYYVLDNAAFLAKARVLSRVDQAAASRRGAQCWLVATLASLVASLLRLRAIRRELRHARRRKLLPAPPSTESPAVHAEAATGDDNEVMRDATASPNGRQDPVPSSTQRSPSNLRAQYRGMVATFAKHASDCVVAGNVAFTMQLHPTVVGFCGVVSSVIGVAQTWPKRDHAE